MQVPKIFVRITKFLGWAILGLLVTFLILLALIHLPPVQKKITHKLSSYLSTKLESKVDIERITFSILGNVAFDNLTVWDPGNNKILDVRKIEVASSIYNLVTGDYIFDQVHIEGATCYLIQHKEELNIQFILDAFKPKEKRTTPTTNPLTLQFKKVELENVKLEFTSSVSGVSVAINLGTLITQSGEFSTNPTRIKADQVILERTIVNTLSTQHSDTHKDTMVSKSNNLLSPDFGTGIIFEIRDLELKENSFSYHRDRVMDTWKFDPAHLSVKNIQLHLSDLQMNPDTLVADIQSLAVQLPGFSLTNSKAEILMNHNQLILSNLHLTSGSNELRANLTAPNIKTVSEGDSIELALQGRLNPADFAYFFSDSVMDHFGPWGPTELVAEGSYTLGKGEIKTLKIKTSNSELHAAGMVNDISDQKKINWKDLVVNATIGADFKKTLTPFLRTIQVPSGASLQLTSSGNPKNINLDGKIFTPWGNAKVGGQIIRQTKNMDIDIKMTGDKVNLGEWLKLSWLGPIDLSAHAKGVVGDNQNLAINGLITEIELLDQSVRHIDFQSMTRKENAMVSISIADPTYRSEVSSEISFAGPLTFTNRIQVDSFNLGRLLQMDSSLFISGDTQSKLIIDSSSLEGYLAGNQMLFHKQSMEYSLDTMTAHAVISPTRSAFEFYTDYANASLVSNFDIRDASEVIQRWSHTILKDTAIHPTASKSASFNLELENASFIKLFGVDVDEFSSLRITGEFDEQKESATLQATSGKFKGYGISLDTLSSNMTIHHDSASASMNASNLLYNSIELGNLDLDLLKKGDTVLSNLQLSNDTITLLGWQSRILPRDSGAFIYTDTLTAFDHDFFIDPENSIHVGKNNLVLNHFLISRDSMQINLEGNLNAFDVSLRHINLTPLNFLISPDTILINKGYLTGTISYSRDEQLNLQAAIDSLSLYNSSPLTITATAASDQNQVPFQFLLTNTSNTIDLKGNYSSNNKAVDATLLLDVNNLELFQFLVTGFVDEMNGAVKGEATIRGPVQKPAITGHLRFLDVELTTVNPKLTFHAEDDSITLDNSALVFNHFTLYDEEHHPLTIDGTLTTKDFQSFAYDLKINSEQYTLINHPDSVSGKLRGLLVIDSDIKLTGNEKDTKVEANITIKDATDLTFANSSDDIALLQAEGIIDFIDPALLLDSAALAQSTNFYDSLIASLPNFNLNSTITLEDNAVLRVLIDEQSGDYIEASGAANLELSYDRSGNLHLAGEYSIKKGVYRLSFYDLAKKNFNLVQGSSINWSGNPESGDLNIKAVHTVESNSIGLIGHEIGENEKSIYKRSLNYEVGINIDGTIEKPIISFSLDLPQNEKVNYPVLANKLDRLRQPEYASELNKQVFGLLVLGGFLPESSADVNSSVIATTALSNSVNSLLASQLNRFASQYVKGVNIDVGIQSFSDYSAPGGKTQTAMDFRVSKSIMNDRLSFEIGGDFDINQDQSGGNTGKNYRGDVAIIYDLTGNGDKQLKLFNNETYDIVYQEIRNTGISLIFIREFESKEKERAKNKGQ